MNVVGIIAEYNPFHKGHAYQIQKAKEQCGAEFAVVVMNGDFVQRGEPAIFDKYTRTKEALWGGADLIFELPVRFGLSSAGDFAMGGILALFHLSRIYVLARKPVTSPLFYRPPPFFAMNPIPTARA